MISIKKLLENIDYAIKKTIYENKEIYQDNLFNIVKYSKENETDALYIKEHKQEIYQFLVNGYKAAGYETFISCSDSKHLVRNYNEIKIAYHNNIPIAISVYSGYLDGFKCVGITATTDEELHKLGVIATHEIIKADIKLYDKFYWCECSDKIEKLYNKYNGIAIPSAYLNYFFEKMPFIEYNADGYHYSRIIAGEPTKKIIYGFNNKNTFNIICNDYNIHVLEAIRKIDNGNVNESVNNIEKASADWSKITVFYEAWLAGYNEHPQEALNILKKAIVDLQNFIDNNSDEISESKLKKYKMAIENGQDILDSSTVLTYHIFK